jgi:hypothetical protein
MSLHSAAEFFCQKSEVARAGYCSVRNLSRFLTAMLNACAYL